MRTRRLTQMGVLTAVALTIFIIEAQIPSPVPIPGVKLGLANIVTVFAVFALGPAEAAEILFGRIFLGAVFAGNFSTFFYSAAGGLLAILATIALRRVVTPKQIWAVSVLAAIGHSLGQMAVALIVTGTVSVLLYLPVLLVSSMAAGLFTGLCAQLLLNRGKKLWNRIILK